MHNSWNLLRASVSSILAFMSPVGIGDSNKAEIMALKGVKPLTN